MYNKTGQQFLLYTDANDIFIMSPGDVLEETKQISTKKCFSIQDKKMLCINYKTVYSIEYRELVDLAVMKYQENKLTTTLTLLGYS